MGIHKVSRKPASNMPETYSFNEQDFSVKIDSEVLKISETGQSLRVVNFEQDHLLLTDGTREYEVWLVEKDSKYWKLNVDGTEILIEKQERLASLFEKIGFEEESKDKISEIKAPMPGAIVEVLVAKDQEIEINDPLVILEAMKMENIIRATAQGTVSDVLVESGSVVQKNEILVKF